MDARSFEIVESLQVDFDLGQWLVKPLRGDYSVGTGLYLMVPVADCQEAEQIKDHIGNKP